MADSLTLRQALDAGRERLIAAGIKDAALEAEVLLRWALGYGKDRGALFQRLGDAIHVAALKRFESALASRIANNPTAYITGVREFYGHDFAVTPDVLIPRPETEQLVEAAIECAKSLRSTKRADEPLLLIDVGTGSGAIAVSLALALPEASIYATDMSPAALGVASGNAYRNGVEKWVTFVRADLLSPVDGTSLPRADVIVANLPYVPSGVVDTLAPEVRQHEPRLALDGGADGLDLIRRLLSQAPAQLNPSGGVCLEMGWDQGEAVSALVAAAMPGAAVSVRKDFAGLDRVVVGVLAEGNR